MQFFRDSSEEFLSQRSPIGPHTERTLKVALFHELVQPGDDGKLSPESLLRR